MIGVDKSAEISPCGTYRYQLKRRWNGERAPVAFLMFNPSTANETEDDATIRKCVGFADRWIYGEIRVFNLFALRSRDPRDVAKAADAVGPQNDWNIIAGLYGVRRLICAWGCSSHMKGSLKLRPPALLRVIRSIHKSLPIDCLGYGADGSPRHPLMLAYSTPIVRYEPAYRSEA